MSGGNDRVPSAVDELVLRLWPAPTSVGTARRAVGEFCRHGRLGDLAADAELLTSELMTNACQHGKGLITVSALRDAAAVAVTVTDDNASGQRPAVQAPDTEREGGRGLTLVDAVAGHWGASRGDARTSVWFRLP